MTEERDVKINEHIFEIRYKPNPKILDYRGTWAEDISAHMQLEHWRIIENRIDIFSDKQIVHAFVGFRNAGLTTKNSPTKNFFPDKTIKLLRHLFTLDGFGDPLHVERIGVRSKFCVPYDGSFQKLCNLYSSNFLVLTDKAKEALGRNAKLIDIGGPLNFADNLGNFNSSSGPMNKEQFEQFIKQEEEFPEVGLYLDVDYWIKPQKKYTSKKVISKFKEFSAEVWNKQERISRIVFGE